MCKRVLYEIPCINSVGGAHIASANLISQLIERGYHIDILTDSVPTADTRIRFGNPEFLVYDVSYSYLKRALMWFWRKVFNTNLYPAFVLDFHRVLRRIMLKYDTICVMSERSKFRKVVASLPTHVRKVQLIHTDYVNWFRSSAESKMITKDDICVYAKMNLIALVGRFNQRAFNVTFPILADKTDFFYNVITAKKTNSDIYLNKEKSLRIVTISRHDNIQKASTRSVRIAARLFKLGYSFTWDFIGEGYEEESEYIKKIGADDNVRFLGNVNGASSLLPNYDLLALFSTSEGLPMVVFESLISGVPVVATSLPGLMEQINPLFGWLFPNDEESIVCEMSHLLEHKESIWECRKRVMNYRYDNESVIQHHLKMLGLA